jgi:PKHD-type hydroxylase
MGETMDPWLSGTVRKLSASIILNEDFEGGEMRFRWFHDEIKESKVLAKKGDAIFFPSNLQHMVSPVTEGTRYSIVKWFGGPPVR